MRQAYAMRDFKKAKQQPENLARRLDDEHPSAAASGREGLVETQTVIKMGLPQGFARTFCDDKPDQEPERHRTLDLPQREALARRHDDLRWCCAAMNEA
jgi:hypothetical protein